MWEALLAQDLASSPLSKALLVLRGYGRRGRRGRRAAGGGAGTLPERLRRFGFTKLEETPGTELVFGLAGRFWRPDGGLRRIPDRAAFAAFAEDGCVKVAWNLRVDAVDAVDADAVDACDLSTETRIAYFGAPARRKFRLYWTLVGPFSGAIRRSLLRGIRRRAVHPPGR